MQALDATEFLIHRDQYRPTGQCRDVLSEAGQFGLRLGVATGLTVLKYRNDLLHFLNDRCGMQLLPEELYHLAELPSHTQVGDVALVATSVLVICTLAAVIPAWQAAKLDPVRALRYE